MAVDTFTFVHVPFCRKNREVSGKWLAQNLQISGNFLGFGSARFPENSTNFLGFRGCGFRNFPEISKLSGVLRRRGIFS